MSTPPDAGHEPSPSSEIETVRSVPWRRLINAFASARSAGAWQEADAIARDGIAAFPNRIYPYHAQAQALIGLGRRHDAVRAIDEALARFGEDASLLDIGWRNQKALGNAEIAIAMIDRQRAFGGGQGALLVDRARLELALYRHERALETLAQAEAAGADAIAVLRLRAAAAENLGRFEDAREYWREIEALGAVSADEVVAAATRLSKNKEVAERYRRETGTVEELMALTSDATTRKTLSLPAGDVSAWRQSHSRSLLLVFGGVLSMMGTVRPSLPSGLPDAGKLNILALADPTRRFLMRGAPSLGETYADTLAALRELQLRWNIDKLYVMGVSSGAHSALRYGVDLGARRMLMLSGWMTVPTAGTHPLLATLRETVADAYEDPRTLIAAARDPVDLNLAYGAANTSDSWQAERLADLPGVRLHPLAGVKTHSLGLEPAHDDLVKMLLRDAD